tara:strand:- start:43 stop:336 length:294 start_codon:yes stop_codon:yes gene_type:complete
MDNSSNFIIDKEKQSIQEKERKKYEEETGKKLNREDNMNIFDWLFYIGFPLGFVVFIVSFIFKFYYKLILIPTLEKNNLTTEQEIQFKKIKNRLILK